jgi:hypothetical protein
MHNGDDSEVVRVVISSTAFCDHVHHECSYACAVHAAKVYALAGLLSRKQLRNEDVFDCEAARGDALFEVITQDSFDRIPVGFDAVWPPVLT